MLFIIGVLVVGGSVITGYLMHYGELRLLWQPNELLIILGAGIGAALIGYPIDELKKTAKALSHLFKTRPKQTNDYIDLLSFFFNIFKLMKVKGMLEIESHLENPEDSELFNQAPSIMRDNSALSFVRDYLRMMTMGVDNIHQFEALLDREIEILEEEEIAPSRVFLTIGDSLPALGIVAAVLGVITTMRSITEPPEVLGSLIAAALVGTFTGVLFAYGLFLPIGHYLRSYAAQKIMFYKCIKAALISHLSGNAPIVTVEFMRKNIPEDLRPDFYQADQIINSRSKNYT